MISLSLTRFAGLCLLEVDISISLSWSKREARCSSTLFARHCYRSYYENKRSKYSIPRNDIHNDVSKPTKARQRIKIMPLGGSITYGQGSSDGNGYRGRLLRMLLSDGFDMEMVGSQKTGTMENNDHEGWRGFRIDQIVSKARLTLPKHKADIFLVNAGANDCIQNFESGSVGKRMQLLLDLIWETYPVATVLLSTLLVNSDRQADLHGANASQCFRKLVDENTGQQRRILIVDMRDEMGPQRHQLVDGTHPDDTGYERMARLWYWGIQESLAKGLLQTCPSASCKQS